MEVCEVKVVFKHKKTKLIPAYSIMMYIRAYSIRLTVPVFYTSHTLSVSTGFTMIILSSIDCRITINAASLLPPAPLAKRRRDHFYGVREYSQLNSPFTICVATAVRPLKVSFYCGVHLERKLSLFNLISSR